MPLNFSLLPNEVLTLIAEYLPLNDLATFIRVSRQLYSLGIRRLLRLAFTFQPRERDSVFEWACENGHLPLVKSLLDLGVSRYLGRLGFDWSFEAAAKNGQTEVIKFLLLESDTPKYLTSRPPGIPPAADAEIPPLHYSILRILLWREDNVSELYDTFCVLRRARDPPDGGTNVSHTPNLLHLAAKRRNAVMARELLRFPYDDVWGENVDDLDMFMHTPLHFAASANASLVVERLVQAKADLGSVDWSGATPLHHAATRGHVDMCELLLNAGANPFVADKNGMTPWHYAEKNAHHKVIELLREKTGVNVPPVQHRHADETSLNFYSRSLDQFLEDGGLDPDLFLEGDSPLQIAVNAQNAAVVQLLLDAGADINQPDDESGDTILHYASAEGYYDMVVLLLDNGADLSAVNDDECMPLHLAADAGHVSVARLLLNAGADSSACDNLDKTPLHYAAAEGNGLVVEALLEAGASVQVHDSFGRSPLLEAADYGYPAVVKRLIAEGANVSAADAFGRTPLHVAASAGHQEVVQLLLDSGADVDAQDDDGFTALHQSGHDGTEGIAEQDVQSYQTAHALQVSFEHRTGSRPLRGNTDEVNTMELTLRSGRVVVERGHRER
jgi:ankyrin repeat protein